MEPKLSVIVPVYNVEEYLKRCIESIQKQTLHELEIILINDGSTDESGRICDKLAEEDSRIKVIHKKNEGQGIARNCGLEMAQGKYVTFIDSDDYVEKNTYESVISKMEIQKAEMISFGYTQDDPQGKILYQSRIRERSYQGDEVRKKFILHFFGDDPYDDDLRGVSACMSVYSREIIHKNQIRFLSERKVFSEDTIFNLEYCKYVDKVVTCQQHLYHYCLKADSFTKGYQKGRWELTLHFTKLLKEYAQYYGNSELVEDRIRMVLWVSLIDSVKQEVKMIEKQSYGDVKARVKAICEQKEVCTFINELKIRGLNNKQKLFYQCIKCKWYNCLVILSYLRNQRGL
ncbi:MAG: glycosyltransferase family 2 protein [Lachnospiraceae bacterium]|nr:glycosyltransferase family 2 protein [Lachnospiraceae bacterium]